MNEQSRSPHPDELPSANRFAPSPISGSENNRSQSSNGITRRAVMRAAVMGIGALASITILRRARAQDGGGDFNPGGRIPVDYDETMSFNEFFDSPPMLGRAEAWRLRVVPDPDHYGDIIRTVNYDHVIPIYGAFRAKPPRGYPHNDVWFDVGDGVIHSSWIVPVREVFNEPEDRIGDGFWGEITVPTSWQHWTPVLRSRRYYDLAYGAVFRVVERQDEEGGRAWYRIRDDLYPGQQWWIQASHVRRIQREEVTPISREVAPDQKYIYISISEQSLVCYESDVPVFATRIASGTTFFDDSGRAHQFNTPYGEHRVIRKMPTRHMVGGDEINDRYDLPGVPWCCFFSASGAAIHGTYWHNDYGHPRSHGCVNVTSDAARWIYRWANPRTRFNEGYHLTSDEERDIATLIVVEH